MLAMGGPEYVESLRAARETDPVGDTINPVDPLDTIDPVDTTYTDPIGPGLLPGEMGAGWAFANLGRWVDNLLNSIAGIPSQSGEYVGEFVDGIFDTVGFGDRSMSEKLAVTAVIAVIIASAGKKSIF